MPLPLAVVLWILFGLIVLGLLPLLICALAYRRLFRGFKTPASFAKKPSDFPGLRAEPVFFPSNKGQRLAGMILDGPEDEPQGLLIFAHGIGGGGYQTYLDILADLALRGFRVLAYDASGNDLSEGRIGGLQQGVIDLEAAIHFARQDARLKDLPIILFGHSWGAYSVTNVLNAVPDVSAVISAAGFDETTPIVCYYGQKFAHVPPGILGFYSKLYERMKFGDYADFTAVKGLAASSAPVLIIQSLDDSTVPPCFGYDLYRKAFGNNPRFTFRLYEDRGHGFMFYTDEGRAYFRDFFKAYNAFRGQKPAPSEAEVRAYVKEHFRREKGEILDPLLMDEIEAFCRRALEKA